MINNEDEKSSNEDYTTDDDVDLIINVDDYLISMTDDDFDLITSDSIQDYNLIKEIFNSSDNIETIIDKFIKLLINIQDEIGYNFVETSQVIVQCISYLNQSPNDISDWLKIVMKRLIYF